MPRRSNSCRGTNTPDATVQPWAGPVPVFKVLITSVKPLRYDARSAVAFPNALLLDAGCLPVPLHVISAFMPPKDRAEKDRVVRTSGVSSWLWWSAEEMPALPEAMTSKSH